ncbi:hypothetical protein QNM99_01205 [Pseudomonas sp. PCH446]
MSERFSSQPPVPVLLSRPNLRLLLGTAFYLFIHNALAARRPCARLTSTVNSNAVRNRFRRWCCTWRARPGSWMPRASNWPWKRG